MAISVSETWTGSNGAAWPAQWVGRVGTQTIQSNTGQAVPASGSFNSARSDVMGVTITNFDYVATVTGSAGSAEQYVSLAVGDGSTTNSVAGTGAYISAGYSIGCVLNYDPTPANSSMCFEIIANGVFNQRAKTTVTFDSPNTLRVRYRKIGSVLYGKVWQASAAEPLAWTATYTLTAADTAGFPAFNSLSIGGQNGSTAAVRSFTFDDLYFNAYQFADTWTGTTGAAWPGQWNAHDAAATIQANAGQIAPPGATALQAGYAALPSVQLGNSDIVTSVQMATAAVDQTVLVGIDGNGINGGVGRDTNQYSLALNYAATAASSSLSILQTANGTTTQLGSSVTKSLTGTTQYRARFQRTDQVLNGRVWAAGTAEPTAWDITYSLTGIPFTGEPSLGVINGAATGTRTATFDDLTVLGTPSTIPLLVQQNAVATATATSTTVTLPSVTAGDGLILTLQNWASGGQPLTSVTDSAGGVWARAAGISNNDPGDQEIWYCSRHPGSASTLTVTMVVPNAATNSVNLSEWSSPLYYAAGVTAAGGSGNPETTALATVAGQLVIGIIGQADNTIAPVQSGTALTGVANSNGSNATAYSVAATPNTTISWSGNGGNWGAATAAFNLSLPGSIKSYQSSTFSIKPVKTWTGSAWAAKPTRRWNGIAWAGGTPITTPKLTRSGSALQINGVTRRFGGANAYWLGLDDNNGGGAYGTLPTHGQITAAMNGLSEMGVNLVRAHTVGMSAGTPNSYETAPGVYSDANLDSADWAVYQAKRNGIYLMTPLTDNWNYYHGGKWNFVHWAYQQNATGLTDTPGTVKDDTNERQFFANTTAGLRIRALFKDYITNWLNHYNPYTGLRYKDDPTIAIVETGNEIYYAAQIGSNEWTQDICSYVKSIAPDKLLADGSAANGIAVSSSPGLTAAACDIVGGHYYPALSDYSNTTGLTGTSSNYGTNTSALQAVYADAASAAGASRAYILGEFPWTRADVQSLYSSVENNANISADLFWAYIANTAAGAAETHGGSFGSDDYPVHRPYSGASEQAYAPGLSRHIVALSGIPATNGAATSTPAVPNLIANRSLRLASDATLLTAGSGTLATDTAMWMEGGSSLKVTPSGTGVYPYWYFTTPANGAPVTAGSQYTAVASLRTTTSGTFGFSAVLLWYKADGTSVSSSAGTSTSAPLGVWTQMSVTATAPTAAAYAAVQVQASNPMNAADVFNVDQYGVFAGSAGLWVA